MNVIVFRTSYVMYKAFMYGILTCVQYFYTEITSKEYEKGKNADHAITHRSRNRDSRIIIYLLPTTYYLLPSIDTFLHSVLISDWSLACISSTLYIIFIFIFIFIFMYVVRCSIYSYYDYECKDTAALGLRTE